MRKFTNVAVILGLLMLPGGCETVNPSQSQQSLPPRDLTYNDNAEDQSVEMQTIWNLFGNTKSSEIKEKLEPCLRFIEEDVPNLNRLNDVAGRCHLFSNKLKSIANEAMADQRRENVNALILSMSARILEATRKVRNASTRTSWTADVPWLTALYNDNYLHILNIMNLVAYDDDYNSYETVEYELTNIVTRFNEAVDPNIYQHIAGEIERDNKHLIMKFHEKLWKVGSYDVKHIASVQKFLNEIKQRVPELRKHRTQRLSATSSAPEFERIA